MWVTDSRMLCSLPRSCLVHPVDRFDSEGWFSSDQVIFLTVFRVFWWKSNTAFKWKDAISGFPVSPGSAEALVRWGGKIKYILLAYFLSNICAKNCHNRTVYVKIIGSCKGGTFLRRGVCSFCNRRSISSQIMMMMTIRVLNLSSSNPRYGVAFSHIDDILWHSNGNTPKRGHVIKVE